MASRDTAQLLLEVDARIATAQRAINQLAKSIQQDAAGIDGSLKKVEQSGERVGRSLGQISGGTRSGFTQLSFQIGDVTQGLAMGTKASTIFAQQSGQVIQALQIMGGEGNKFLRFMGGPWGMAISTAAVILATLVPKLLENRDAVGALVDKMREQAKQARLNEEANAIWERSLDGLIDKSRKLRDESTKALQTERELARAKLDEAKGTLSQAERERDRIGRQLENARRQLRDAKAALVAAQAFAATAGPEQAGEAAAGLSGAQQRVGSAGRSVSRLVGELQTATAAAQNTRTAVDNLGVSVARVEAAAMADPIKSRFKALREEAERTIQDVDRLSKRLAELDKQEKAADAAASGRGGDRRTKQQAYQDFVGALGGQGVDITSGFRTQAQQDSLRGRLGSDAARSSLHTAYRAVDVAITVSDERILASAGEAGLQGVKIKAKPNAKGGPHKHVSWSGYGVRGDPENPTAGKDAESEAEREEKRRNAFEEQLDRLNQELVRAKGELLQGTDAEADFAVQMVQLEQRRLDAAVQNDVAEKKLTQAEADQLKAKHAQVAFERIKAIEIGRQLEKMRSASEAEQRIFEYRIDDMRFADEMATTQAEQRRLQLDILDIVYQQKEARLRALKAELELAGKLEEAAAVQTQIDRLGTEKGQDRERVMRGTMNPLEAWAQTVPQTSAEITEALQRIQVEGLDSLASAITNVITGTQSLGEAFGDVARRIVADIIQMTVRMLIFRAISGIMGGGTTTPNGAINVTAFPSAKGNIFSNGNVVPFARGGIVSTPMMFPMRDGRTGLMGEAGPEAIMPLARDSMGRLGVRAANAASAAANNNGPIEVVVRVEASDDLMVKAAVVADARIRASEPRIVRNAATATIQAATRPALMGRR